MPMVSRKAGRRISRGIRGVSDEFGAVCIVCSPASLASDSVNPVRRSLRTFFRGLGIIIRVFIV